MEAKRTVPPGTIKESLKRNEILRRRVDMNRVMRTGRQVSGPALYLRYSPTVSPEENQRHIAFLLSRGIKLAVKRNLLKRRLREIYRRHKDWFPAGFDYSFRATSSAADLNFSALLEQTRNLTRKLRDDCRNN